MKVISLILLTIFMSKGCSEVVKEDFKNTSIQYVANTRGSYQKITIQNQELLFSKNRNDEGNGSKSKISDDDWKQLATLFSKIDLDKLNSYEAPSQKRFHDGAAMANLNIIHKEKEYQSLTFDNGNPPVEIADFVNKVTSLVKQE
jgi:hypothetical protein